MKIIWISVEYLSIKRWNIFNLFGPRFPKSAVSVIFLKILVRDLENYKSITKALHKITYFVERKFRNVTQAYMIQLNTRRVFSGYTAV